MELNSSKNQDYYTEKLFNALKKRGIKVERKKASPKQGKTPAHWDLTATPKNKAINIEVKCIEPKKQTYTYGSVYTYEKPDGKPREDYATIRNQITESIHKGQLPLDGTNVFWIYTTPEMDVDEFQDVLMCKKQDGSKYDGLFNAPWECQDCGQNHSLEHVSAVIAEFPWLGQNIVVFVNPNIKTTCDDLPLLGVKKFISPKKLGYWKRHIMSLWENLDWLGGIIGFLIFFFVNWMLGIVVFLLCLGACWFILFYRTNTVWLNDIFYGIHSNIIAGAAGSLITFSMFRQNVQEINGLTSILFGIIFIMAYINVNIPILWHYKGGNPINVILRRTK